MGLENFISAEVKENEKEVINMIKMSLEGQPWEVVTWREFDNDNYYDWKYELKKSDVKTFKGIEYNIELKITVLQRTNPGSDQKDERPRRVEELYSLYSNYNPSLRFYLDLKQPSRYESDN